jgi:hypothetical protein
VVHLARVLPNTYLIGVKMRVSLLTIATAAALACTAAAGCELLAAIVAASTIDDPRQRNANLDQCDPCSCCKHITRCSML